MGVGKCAIHGRRSWQGLVACTAGGSFERWGRPFHCFRANPSSANSIRSFKRRGSQKPRGKRNSRKRGDIFGAASLNWTEFKTAAFRKHNRGRNRRRARFGFNWARDRRHVHFVSSFQPKFVAAHIHLIWRNIAAPRCFRVVLPRARGWPKAMMEASEMFGRLALTNSPIPTSASGSRRWRAGRDKDVRRIVLPGRFPAAPLRPRAA